MRSRIARIVAALALVAAWGLMTWRWLTRQASRS